MHVNGTGINRRNTGKNQSEYDPFIQMERVRGRWGGGKGVVQGGFLYGSVPGRAASQKRLPSSVILHGPTQNQICNE